MKENFSHLGSGKLLFGNGLFSDLPTLVSLEHSLLVCGLSFLHTEQYQSIAKQVKFQRTISGEPDPDRIDSITNEVRGKIDSVIAVGGGSSLDAGKAIAAMCCSEGSVEEYLEGVGKKSPNGKSLPLIAIPTTAGTGSEATKNAVISRRGVGGFKKSLRHDNYIPPIIIIDPLLYLSCPSDVFNSCGMDAFSQLLESFISTDANILTDTLAWRGLTIFIDNFLELCLSETKDLRQMGEIAFAAYLSGITLANAGLGTVHGIAGPLGGLYDIPHGTACGTLLPEVLRKTVDKLYSEDRQSSELIKLEKLGNYISDSRKQKREIKPADVVCRLVNIWLRELRIPGLSHYGIEEKSVKIIAAASGNKSNPVQFRLNEIEEIIKARI